MVKAIKHLKKINNKGSALVTVIVVACLISVIATTLLFVSVKTYKARQIEYQSKQNFYEAEKSLDELKSQMIVVTSDSCRAAYIEMMNVYLNNDAGARQSEFRKKFVAQIKNKLKNRGYEKDSLTAIKKNLSNEAAKDIESVGPASDFIFNEAEGYIIIPDITISSTTTDGYYSRIVTDIRIEAPDIDWTGGSKNKEPHTFDMTECVYYVNWERD